MTGIKWILLLIFSFASFWSISALDGLLGRSKGASLEVYLNSYSSNMTVVMNNRTSLDFR